MPHRPPRLLHHLGLACFLAGACGGELEPPTSQRPSAVLAEEGSQEPDVSTGNASTPANATCAAPVVTCQPFDPGGPERWGCSTPGADPELACEHAAGTSLARCNCSGHFGEPAPDAQGTDGITWFDVPATSTPFTDDQVLKIWRGRCHGGCVRRSIGPDGG